MVKGEAMSQGDYVKIDSKVDAEKKLPFLLKRVNSWDYSTALVIRFEQFDNPRSINQNALFHIWCREMAAVFSSKVPDASEDGMKFMMKSKFLGTHTVNIGKQTYADQIMPLPKNKGEMCFFMDQVYHWAAEKDVLLSLPQYNEYTALKRKQEE